eukprot:CAMPEP_0181170696 /NCGR_PEP_ID=MMETSP1096-20121128/1504_1 /TAXON_ID=156174 ORGANISM="Chrysochromulina ericina, Strain CCMP281" /NCGR_SAMPLE_ID=MMETSP1096 /ASSEMBLY_ACC=CAM_ASM_000453 /LENGTH=92 /DNA_ID=CAMNT_0023258275 /DNA_START=428 /DNA_END=706 /DNA_ORIENTATION=-
MAQSVAAPSVPTSRSSTYHARAPFPEKIMDGSGSGCKAPGRLRYFFLLPIDTWLVSEPSPSHQEQPAIGTAARPPLAVWQINAATAVALCEL